MLRNDYSGWASFLYFWLTAPGSTLTAGRNWLGVYDKNGVLLTSQSTDTLFTGSGGRTATSMGFMMPANYLWVVLLSDGTTRPTFAAKPVGPATNFQSPWGGYPVRALWSDDLHTTLPATTTFTGPWTNLESPIPFFGFSRA
jgi:hypothetical protein